jgi:Flp pilus assembly protein TadD
MAWWGIAHAVGPNINYGPELKSTGIAAPLREAVKTQDSLPYGEPPAWFYPVRESLGALLLKRSEIANAETTFSEGLRLSPNDPRLLFGLSEAQRAAGHSADAQTNWKKFVALWQGPRGEPKLAAF